MKIKIIIIILFIFTFQTCSKIPPESRASVEIHTEKTMMPYDPTIFGGFLEHFEDKYRGESLNQNPHSQMNMDFAWM